MEIIQKELCVFPAGEKITEITVCGKNIQFSALNYGCILTSICVFDKYGKSENIILRYDDVYSYIKNPSCCGAIVGRVANRISGASFLLDGKRFCLDKNENGNCLHGGNDGWQDKFYDFAPFDENGEIGVRFFRKSIAGEQGFPGNVDLCVTYKISGDKFFTEIQAKSDKVTPLNVISHVYYNLSGKGRTKNSIGETKIKLNFNRYLEMKNHIPTGKILDVMKSPLDFTEFKSFDDAFSLLAPQNQVFDDCFVKEKCDNDFGKIFLASQIYDKNSGRKMELRTNQVALQLYTPHEHNSFCLETQGYVDAISHDSFPSIFINPEKLYKSFTELYFFY